MNNRRYIIQFIDYKYSAAVVWAGIHIGGNILNKINTVILKYDMLMHFAWMADSTKHSNGIHLSFSHLKYDLPSTNLAILIVQKVKAFMAVPLRMITIKC